MNKKKFYSIVALCAAVLLAAALFILIPVFRKTVVGFYGIPAQTADQIASYIQAQTKVRITMLDAEKPLAEALKKRPRPDLVFTLNGKSMADLADSALPPLATSLPLMPTSMRNAGTKNGTPYAVPLLLNHFEILYNVQILKKTGTAGTPRSLETMIAFAGKAAEYAKRPIFCAGSSDENLLMLVSALTEARCGDTAWRALADAVSTHTAQTGNQVADNALFGKLLDVSLSEHSGTQDALTLRTILNELVGWKASGLLHPEWLRMTDSEVQLFMETNSAAVIFTTLANHRTIPLRTIDQYQSSWFPAGRSSRSRSLIIPALCGVIRTGRRAGKPDSPAALLDMLVQPAAQTAVSQSTGLAPVGSTAEAQDKQASDVRLWAASADSILTDLGSFLFADPEHGHAFAAFIRDYLAADGNI